MKSLPLGIQTFRDIIEKGQLYVDKTHDVHNLISLKEKYFFLSRPRRFGKSLLISTLEELFKGNKELFKDLWIYEKIEWKKYPVIRLDFSGLTYSEGIDGFKKSLVSEVKNMYKQKGLNIPDESDYKILFKNLIEELSKQDKVVLLIDEYDKPIIEFIDNIEIANEMRNILRNFYGVIKYSDQYLKFCFITGISKFSKVSIFSELNNLRDITLSDKFATICGYTQTELYSYFDEHIKILANHLEIDIDQCKAKIQKWYNGYSWDGKNFVYNPFSILYLFTENEIRNYWFESGSPSLLLKFIKKYHVDIQKIENIELSQQDFSSYEVDNMNMNALLFQTGYLTIKEIKKYPDNDLKQYVLSYPNEEVRNSFNYSIFRNITNDSTVGVFNQIKIVTLLVKNDLDGFFNHLKAVFGSIPSNIIPNQTSTNHEKEYYYHTIFYLILKLIGVNIKCEVSTSKGRIDAVIHTSTHIYIFEFKIGRSPKKAIEQIDRKDYLEMFLDSQKKIVKIGVNFSVAKRNIKECKIVPVN